MLFDTIQLCELEAIDSNPGAGTLSKLEYTRTTKNKDNIQSNDGQILPDFNHINIQAQTPQAALNKTKLISKESSFGQQAVTKENSKSKIVCKTQTNFNKNKRHSSMNIQTNEKLEKEIEIIEKARLRMEKKMERKLISQAAKNFNKYIHIKNLK